MPEPGNILEEQVETQLSVAPHDVPPLGVGTVVEYLIGWPDGDVHFPTVGAPPGVDGALS